MVHLHIFFFLATLASSLEASQIPLTDRTPLSIPLLGYGTWQLDHSNVSEAVSSALQTGYRHIDCAAAYRNERDVGKGIAPGLAAANLTRGDIWVTSKLWNDHHQPDRVEQGLDQTLSDLDVDYLDLFLMHWPVASSPLTGQTYEDYVDTWQAMEALLQTNKVRHIGISNFSPHQLNRLLLNAKIRPFAHQMELHPYLQQRPWIQWHRTNQIHTTAYSPLGNSNPIYGSPEHPGAIPALLDNNIIKGIADLRGCTAAQVVLAWGMKRGTSVIPKSSHASRIVENYEALMCELDEEDFGTVDGLQERFVRRFNDPSESWGVELFEGLDGV